MMDFAVASNAERGMGILEKSHFSDAFFWKLHHFPSVLDSRNEVASIFFP
jgi:hypothetical protein